MNSTEYLSASSVIFLLIITFITSCSTQQTPNEDEALKKISFNLEQLNEEGLYGPPDGLMSLDYKFCIPMKDEFKDEVEIIDSTISFHKGTGIEDGCSTEEYLCIGNTHQKDYRNVLIKLASLEYVERIDQMFWEK